MDSTSSPDPSRCPLCGMRNGCAMDIARETGAAPPASCWCMTASFDQALLARIPTAARGAACICARCAADARH